MVITLRQVELADKYRLERGQVFMTGTQALVRLALMQRQLDLRSGLNTGGYISGYRGSPLGAFDQQLWMVKNLLEEHHIKFHAGLNEDLAATAIWGTQQLDLAGPTDLVKYDGVFGMWYGKGPGVDRSGDAFRHANLAGTHKHGGVLALAGDDHTCKSSTTTHQSEYAFMDAMIPVLTPSTVQEFIDFGLYGYAMSRYSGCWTALKCVAETIETSASISVDLDRIKIKTPTDFEIPTGGLNVRWYPQIVPGIHEQERRLHMYKIPAVQAFVRANKLDKVLYDNPKARLGIVTTGKSYLDIRQAFEMLGLDEDFAKAKGIKIYKVACVYPMEPEGLKDFARGLDELFIIEEKRPVMESQIKDILFNIPANQRPRVVGKTDETGAPLLWSHYEITPSEVAQALGKRLMHLGSDASMENRLAYLQAREDQAKNAKAAMTRMPYFCSGCPHSTSTNLPEGSRALAGIGCHFMTQAMDRNTSTYTHMGAEGAHWMGQFAFTDEKHVFVNIGDGTYYHSGLLAIRAAVASGANMTYKILFNDAVAMTGGQPVDELYPQRVLDQVVAEGAKRVVILTDDLSKYPDGIKGGTLHHRDDLLLVQEELREIEGVTAIIYEQTCATEKRRRRKRGLMEDPDKRMYINPEVCEGCGDCGVQSNCVSIAPLETELGRKRQIDQSSCNKDFSCVKGFCPSFVTVKGGQIRKDKAVSGVKPDLFAVLPDPELPNLENRPFNLYVAGIGGTGVVTIGAIIGMAGHLESKGVGILDSLGLAQKGGAVVTHVRIGKSPQVVHTSRVATADADLILGCDMVTATQADALAKLERGLTHALLNTVKTYTGAFTRNPDLQYPDKEMISSVEEAIGKDATLIVDATRIATALMGDAIAANMFMLGYAYQKGLVPVGSEAIERAIELNGIAIPFNKQAFVWGRRAAFDLPAVEKLLNKNALPEVKKLETVDDIVEDRAKRLTAYQNASYAQTYRALLDKLKAKEKSISPNKTDLSKAVATYLYKVMAIKDEYEVARLYSEDSFRENLKQQFTGDLKLTLNLAPPLISKRNPQNGKLVKREYGPWVFSVFKVLTKLKGLRGGKLDIFGYTQERRDERKLREDYSVMIAGLCHTLTAENYALAVDLASLPEQIRGFGHVKEAALTAARLEWQRLELSYGELSRSVEIKAA